PSCFTPRWEWQPGSDHIDERVTPRAVEAQATGRVRVRALLNALTGARLSPRGAAEMLHAPRLTPLAAGTQLRSGDCTIRVEAQRLRITRGEDNVTIAGGRLYAIDAPGARFVISAHDGAGIAEVGAYLLAPTVP
ncbi:MAG: hypothetical protein KGM44_10015, partial [bacterium]|nr:hypothetical protein [bacterium]